MNIINIDKVDKEFPDSLAYLDKYQLDVSLPKNQDNQRVPKLELFVILLNINPKTKSIFLEQASIITPIRKVKTGNVQVQIQRRPYKRHQSNLFLPSPLYSTY